MIIELDAQLSVRIITDFSYINYSVFGSVIYDCKPLFNEANNVNVSYIFRSVNVVVHVSVMVRLWLPFFDYGCHFLTNQVE